MDTVQAVRHEARMGTGPEFDAVVIGAGVAGLYQLYRLRELGLPTDRQYLFIIDGAKALRAAIDEVFGAGQPVQRCRNHKLENVMQELPKEQQSQTRKCSSCNGGKSRPPCTRAWPRPISSRARTAAFAAAPTT